MTKFFRAIRIALQYMSRNFGLSFATVMVMTLSFFIVSIMGIAFFGSYYIVKYIDSKPGLVVFLRGDLTEEQSTEFKNIVESSGYSKSVTVSDIDNSRKEFLKTYNESDIDKYLEQGENAKKALSVTAYVYSDSQENLKKLVEVLNNNEYFKKNIVDQANLERVGWYAFNFEQAEIIRDVNSLVQISGGIITAFLFVISFILIFITVKLTINYHKKELEIMDLVGADGWFIRFPFIFSGIIYGVLGAFLSTSIVFLLRTLITDMSKSFVPKMAVFFGEVPWPVINTELIIEIYLVTIFIGAFVGAISSFSAILRYVKRY